MSKIPFRPLLAGKIDDVEKLKYPVLVSPKLDGIRAIGTGEGLLSRSGKEFPNAELRKMFAGNGKHLAGLDGELIVGSPCDPEAFRRTDSVVMSADASLKGLVYYVFDIAPSLACDGDLRGNKPGELEYARRSVLARTAVTALRAKGLPVKFLEHKRANYALELLAFENDYLSKGYEGLMVRSLDGYYKEGRSTLKEGILLKLKRFCDSEAEILGFQEKQKNNNEKTLSALGYAKRSSHKANKVAVGTLGALHVRDCKTGVEFDIGTGFDDATRQRIWERREALTGKIVKYKFFPSGSKDRPRFPTFIWFRDKRDMEK